MTVRFLEDSELYGFKKGETKDLPAIEAVQLISKNLAVAIKERAIDPDAEQALNEARKRDDSSK